MSIITGIVADAAGRSPLAGKSVLVCTYDTTATSKVLRAMADLGARVAYFPVSHGDGHAAATFADDQRVSVVNLDEDVVRDALPTADIVLEESMRMSRFVFANPDRFKWKDGLYTIEQTTSGIRGFENAAESGLPYPVVDLASSEIKR